MQDWAYSNVECYSTIVPRCVWIAKCWISFNDIVFGHCLCIPRFDLLFATWPLITGWRVYLECLFWISVFFARRIRIVGQTSTFVCTIYVFACHITILTLSLIPNSCGIWGFWMPMDHFGCSNTLGVSSSFQLGTHCVFPHVCVLLLESTFGEILVAEPQSTQFPNTHYFCFKVQGLPRSHQNGLRLVHKGFLGHGMQVRYGFYTNEPPPPPKSNKTLPHMEGHCREDVSNGDTEPVQSTTYLLEHIDPHMQTLPQVVHISLYDSQSQHVTPLPSSMHVPPRKILPFKEGRFGRECSHCKLCRTKSIEVDQPRLSLSIYIYIDAYFCLKRFAPEVWIWGLALVVKQTTFPQPHLWISIILVYVWLLRMHTGSVNIHYSMCHSYKD